MVTSISGYAAWRNVSDKRLKQNIQPSVHRLDFITNLQPLTYNYISQPNVPQLGFAAQDVLEAGKDFAYINAIVDKNGQPKKVKNPNKLINPQP